MTEKDLGFYDCYKEQEEMNTDDRIRICDLGDSELCPDEELLTAEEMTEIRMQVPESERGDIQGLIQRYLQAQIAKVRKHCDHLVAEKTGICLHCGVKITKPNLKHRLDSPELKRKIDLEALAGTHRVIPCFKDYRDGEPIDAYLTSASITKILNKILALIPLKED